MRSRRERVCFSFVPCFPEPNENKENIVIANCNIKLSISSVRISQVTARCGLGEEGAVGDRRGQAGRAGQAA